MGKVEILVSSWWNFHVYRGLSKDPKWGYLESRHRYIHNLSKNL